MSKFKAATEAGREWGRYLTEQPPPYQRLDAGQAIEILTAAHAATAMQLSGERPDYPSGPPEARLNGLIGRVAAVRRRTDR